MSKEKVLMIRSLCIVVEKTIPEDQPFCYLVPDALREFAERIEKEESGKTDCEIFTAKNGCVIKFIEGANTIINPSSVL